MSALREWAAALGGAAHSAVAVSSIGKWKTATQARHSVHRCRAMHPLPPCSPHGSGSTSAFQTAHGAHLSPAYTHAQFFEPPRMQGCKGLGVLNYLQGWLICVVRGADGVAHAAAGLLGA